MSNPAPSGGDLSRLRQLNSLAAIRVLRGAEPLTLSVLAERTGLSRPSTKDVMDELVGLGWVEEVAPVAGTMGRPARRYRFRADGGHVVGVDIGAHKVLAALADLDGNILAETRHTVDPDTPTDARLDAIDKAIAGCLSLAGLTRRDLWAVTAGTTGLVDPEGRVALSTAIRNWSGVDLAGRLSEMFPCTVLVENDSKLAALAEWQRGVAQGAKDVLFLHAGRRTGAGLIVDGKLHRGFAGSAGEISLLPLSRWADGSALLDGSPVVPTGIPPQDAARYVLSAARDGDPAAMESVERYVEVLALGAAMMVLTVDPELVILGGSFSRAADILLPPLRRRLAEVCMRPPELRVSTLGDECVVLGGIGYAIHHLDGRLFGVEGGLPTPLPQHADAMLTSGAPL
ncbi:ROK family transcriptional regulator [Sphaerisporangium perillae]|uniref:ROK family transcriptional regulator n=1 Tax=Sphaerisporangium perillae TaxID=2935860 RepID=UPI00200CD4F1|nr:ROK family transcriptional regulator [Sphaerisporangium perillae]